MVDEQKIDKLWSTLSVKEQKYLIRKHALTGFEARHMLGVSTARFTRLIQSGKISYIKKDTSAMLFLLSDVEKRVEEDKALRKKHVLKIEEW